MTNADDGTQIRARLDAWVKAASSGKIDAIMANYAPDVRAFDAIGAFQFPSAAAYREHWEMCLSHMHGPMRFEINDLDIATEGSLAFCHYLATCACTTSEGKEQVGRLRATVCMRKIDGDWLIVHEHFSVPIDPMTGKAESGMPAEDAAQASAA